VKLKSTHYKNNTFTDVKNLPGDFHVHHPDLQIIQVCSLLVLELSNKTPWQIHTHTLIWFLQLFF